MIPSIRSGWHGSMLVWHGAEDAEPYIEVLADVHDGRDIAAAVTIIWSGPDRDHVSVFEMVLIQS